MQLAQEPDFGQFPVAHHEQSAQFLRRSRMDIVRRPGAKLLISRASSTGRCNTIQCVDSTVLPRENTSVWLYSVKT